jgi:1-phosphofructokinase
MIYTCTLNPSIDYLIEVDHLRLGSLNRTKKAQFYPGGKGINVSRVLKNIGMESTALGFVGGFTGDYIKTHLSAEGITHQFIEHDHPTRINVKLKTDNETEINGNGAEITEEQQQQLLKHIQALAEEDFLVLAGSLPPSISINYYKLIAQICSEKGIPFIVDVSGPALTEVLQYKPFLIKPNQHELSDIVGAPIETKEDALHYGTQLLERGAENVIISMGGDGAIFINRHKTAHASVPKGEVKNTVGAGDSTVAGFLAAYVKDKDELNAFQYGVASGTATAFSTDLCKRDQVENILPQIVVNRMK